MQTYELKTRSWHHYLATWGGPSIWPGDVMDICTYIRRVLSGAIKFLLVMSILCALAVTMIYVEVSFCYCGFLLLTGMPWAEVAQYKMAAPAGAGVVINTVLMLGALATWYRNSNVQVRIPTPGFVSLATEKFRSRTCFRIQFR